jgi:hypothetical protein
MEFSYFTLNNNHYVDNRRSTNQSAAKEGLPSDSVPG